MLWIRADGNAYIGVGHLMRCLTIADEIQKEAGDSLKIVFICADDASAEFVQKHGHEALTLHTDYRDMESELHILSAMILKYKERYTHHAQDEAANQMTDVFLTDSYFVTENYLKNIGKFCTTALMDDMQKTAYPVDAVINYNAFADEDIYKKLYAGTETKLYTGSRYIPIRPQFKGCDYHVTKEVKNVLITTGGGDSENIAGKILAALNDCDSIETLMNLGKTEKTQLVNNKNNIEYQIVIGKFNPHMEEMKKLEAVFPWIHVHTDVQDMAGLMKKCDLAISAGGTTLYELAAVGVPVICFSYAENQQLLTEYLDREGIMTSAGRYHEMPEAVTDRIKCIFDRYVNDYELREKCSVLEKKLVDGMGGQRLAECIIRLSVQPS
jgi:spore coat polysaccharide biosynthesis predicted glycosyltransferase SpsG